MLNDKLYEKIPKPDIVLGQHVTGAFKAGTVLIRSGVFMASADSFKITIFGRGAHGAAPQDSIDPIILAASIIVRLQTVVAREIGPQDVASVTCASIHGGKTHNVIPDKVELLLNIRTFDTEVREKVLAAIKRIIRGEAIASGVEKYPDMELISSFPLTFNDPVSTSRLEEEFKVYFDNNRTLEAPRWTASEDFSNLALDIGVPSVFWNWGGVEAKKWERFEKEKDSKLLPQAHQDNYELAVEPTLQTGIDALSLAALSFLNIVEEA
jgi:amidohydrolase